jgi:hypothetical protein
MTYSGRMPDGPFITFRTVTKSDATVYDPPIMLLRCEEAGAVTLKNLAGTSYLITVLAGEFIPGPIKQLMSAGTAGTLFTAWFNEG